MALETGREIGVLGSCHGVLGDRCEESMDEEIEEAEAGRESHGSDITKFDLSDHRPSVDNVAGGGRESRVLSPEKGVFRMRSLLATVTGGGLTVVVISEFGDIGDDCFRSGAVPAEGPSSAMASSSFIPPRLL